jgi:hypothetical protein
VLGIDFRNSRLFFGIIAAPSELLSLVSVVGGLESIGKAQDDFPTHTPIGTGQSRLSPIVV